jgi:hypothetical protein
MIPIWKHRGIVSNGNGNEEGLGNLDSNLENQIHSLAVRFDP